MNGYLRITACVAIGMFGVACSSGSSGPLSGLNPAAPAATAASDGHGLVLQAVVGEGTGIVNVTTDARTGDFVVNTQDAVHVREVAPDTLLYVRVAVDAGLPGGQQSDGICQRANLGAFGPIATYPGGPPATIETSPGGTGTVHIVGGLRARSYPTAHKWISPSGLWTRFRRRYRRSTSAPIASRSKSSDLGRVPPSFVATRGGPATPAQGDAMKTLIPLLALITLLIGCSGGLLPTARGVLTVEPVGAKGLTMVGANGNGSVRRV